MKKVGHKMAYKLLMALFPRLSMCRVVDVVAACKGTALLQLKYQHGRFLART